MEEEEKTPPEPPCTEVQAEKEEEQAPSLEEELARSEDQLLRLHAEMENLRKRTTKEIERSRLSAIEFFARDLLEVLDNIGRAQVQIGDQKLDQGMKEGFSLIFTAAEKMLERHDIRKIEALGKAFDPNYHEALFEDYSGQVQAGLVSQIIEEGYMLGDRLLRAARVGVAAEKVAPEPAEEAAEEKAEEAAEEEAGK